MNDDYRIALRPDSSGALDDVVILGVSMFRMERLSDDSWWVCCNLEGSKERVSFCLRWDAAAKTIGADIQDLPPAGFQYEAGSMGVDENPS